jgi:hypothetical protein
MRLARRRQQQVKRRVKQRVANWRKRVTNWRHKKDKVQREAGIVYSSSTSSTNERNMRSWVGVCRELAEGVANWC